jgi:hypothetical protein
MLMAIPPQTGDEKIDAYELLAVHLIAGMHRAGSIRGWKGRPCGDKTSNPELWTAGINFRAGFLPKKQFYRSGEVSERSFLRRGAGEDAQTVASGVEEPV